MAYVATGRVRAGYGEDPVGGGSRELYVRADGIVDGIVQGIVQGTQGGIVQGTQGGIVSLWHLVSDGVRWCQMVSDHCIPVAPCALSKLSAGSPLGRLGWPGGGADEMVWGG